MTPYSTLHTHDNPSTLPSRTNSVIINAGNTGAFYQAQRYAGSADSFASSASGAPPHDEEHEQVTQMETIAGRVSIGRAVGGIIARRLSRSRTRSRDILATPGGLVIGVSVEEATTEADAEGDTDVDADAEGDVERANEKRRAAAGCRSSMPGSLRTICILQPTTMPVVRYGVVSHFVADGAQSTASTAA